MGTKRVIAGMLCAAFLLSGLPGFAGQGVVVQTARRGADDAEEHGGRRGDHHVTTPAVAQTGSETGDPKAKALFEAKCSACHALSRPLGKNKDRDGWEKTVTRMQKVNGCPITDAEAKEIVDYLVAVRGPAGK
jgi:cytochrome c5